MGLNTSARIIKGITYHRGTLFKLNGEVPCYTSCDALSPACYKNSEEVYYNGYVTDSYAKHPYGIHTQGIGSPEFFVDESAFPSMMYTIEYVVRGNGYFPTQTKRYGEDITLHEKNPVHSGYTFLGWGVSEYDKQGTYFPGDVYSGNANLTLYDIYGRGKYYITYDANGGVGAPPAQEFNPGGTAMISLKQPTREGYTFVHWQVRDRNIYYTPGKIVTLGNVNGLPLVAQWRINTYHFIAVGNGGEFPLGGDGWAEDVEYETTFEFPTPTREGYAFAGWAQQGKGTLHEADGKYSFTMGNSDVYLEAQWTVNEYTLTLNANANDGAPSIILGYDYGEYAGTKEEAHYTPQKPYSDFIGWYESPENDDSAPIDLGTLLIDRNIVLYARFKEKATVLMSIEGSNRPAILAVCPKDKYTEKTEVMIYVDGVWRKAVVQT